MSNRLQSLAESGYLPDCFIRFGIRQLLKARLREFDWDAQAISDRLRQFTRHMREARIAELPHKANDQHYEVPAAFFERVLGQHLKYSCGYWQNESENLDQSEHNALTATVDHARLQDGQQVLELGCGWGSLTLHMAKTFPNSEITAVSNSASQADFIRRQVKHHELCNVQIVTADMNTFEADGRFDRVVSVEMFEHMRNWQKLFGRIQRWLQPNGLFLMHIFLHQKQAYLFEDRGASDWMSRHFFSGGMMPCADLPLLCGSGFDCLDRWYWSGQHYQKTSDAWLQNMDNHKVELMPVLESTYGTADAPLWWNRWRIFFMSCAELFGHNKGNEWFVGHYLFQNRRAEGGTA